MMRRNYLSLKPNSPMHNLFSVLTRLGNFKEYPATLDAVVSADSAREPILTGLESLLSVLFALKKYRPIYNWNNRLKMMRITPRPLNFEELWKKIISPHNTSPKGQGLVDHFNQVLQDYYIEDFDQLIIASCVPQSAPITILEEDGGPSRPIQIRLRELSDPNSFDVTMLWNMLTEAMTKLKMLDYFYKGMTLE